MTTGLDPAMTLGCGGWGGNITSDNISPKHLLNIKRLAYELRPARVSSAVGALPRSPASPADPRPLPKVAAAPVLKEIGTPALTARIDAFLSARGYRPDGPA